MQNILILLRRDRLSELLFNNFNNDYNDNNYNDDDDNNHRNYNDRSK